jgi:hypothetical protein
LEKTRVERRWSNKRERIPILFGEFVETAVINSEAEGAVLVLDKKNGWASGRLGRRDELVVEVLVQEFPKGQLFGFGAGVYRTVWSSIVYKVDGRRQGVEAEG